MYFEEGDAIKYVYKLMCNSQTLFYWVFYRSLAFLLQFISASIDETSLTTNILSGKQLVKAVVNNAPTTLSSSTQLSATLSIIEGALQTFRQGLSL